MNFEAMIKVPVAPLIERIKHDLSVFDEEQAQIAMAYAMTKLERNEFYMRQDTLNWLKIEYSDLTGEERDRFGWYRRYDFGSKLDYLRHSRDPAYLEKIRALLVACENSIDGFVYIHDMMVYNTVGKFVITPGILKIGIEDVERIKDQLANLQAEIDEIRQKIIAYHQDHALDDLLKDDNPTPEPENYKAMLPLVIVIGVILAVIVVLKFTQ